MNILSLEALTKTVGLKTLFENGSFGMDESEKVGVITLTDKTLYAERSNATSVS